MPATDEFGGVIVGDDSEPQSDEFGGVLVKPQEAGEKDQFGGVVLRDTVAAPPGYQWPTGFVPPKLPTEGPLEFKPLVSGPVGIPGSPATGLQQVAAGYQTLPPGPGPALRSTGPELADEVADMAARDRMFTKPQWATGVDEQGAPVGMSPETATELAKTVIHPWTQIGTEAAAGASRAMGEAAGAAGGYSRFANLTAAQRRELEPRLQQDFQDALDDLSNAGRGEYVTLPNGAIVQSSAPSQAQGDAVKRLQQAKAMLDEFNGGKQEPTGTVRQIFRDAAGTHRENAAELAEANKLATYLIGPSQEENWKKDTALQVLGGASKAGSLALSTYMLGPAGISLMAAQGYEQTYQAKLDSLPEAVKNDPIRYLQAENDAHQAAQEDAMKLAATLKGYQLTNAGAQLLLRKYGVGTGLVTQLAAGTAANTVAGMGERAIEGQDITPTPGGVAGDVIWSAAGMKAHAKQMKEAKDFEAAKAKYEGPEGASGLSPQDTHSNFVMADALRRNAEFRASGEEMPPATEDSPLAERLAWHIHTAEPVIIKPGENVSSLEAIAKMPGNDVNVQVGTLPDGRRILYDPQHPETHDLDQAANHLGIDLEPHTGEEVPTTAPTAPGQAPGQPAPGFRNTQSPQSVEYQKRGGWKLHLGVAPENYAAVDAWLRKNHPGQYKLLKGGDPGESDFTVYVGDRAAADALAQKIHSEIGDLVIKRSGTKVSADENFNESVSGRFDPRGSEQRWGPSGTNYGLNGLPFDQEAQEALRQARMAPSPEARQKWIDILTNHMARIRQELTAKFGDQFTGRTGPSSSTGEGKALEQMSDKELELAVRKAAMTRALDQKDREREAAARFAQTPAARAGLRQQLMEQAAGMSRAKSGAAGPETPGRAEPPTGAGQVDLADLNPKEHLRLIGEIQDILKNHVGSPNDGSRQIGYGLQHYLDAMEQARRTGDLETVASEFRHLQDLRAKAEQFKTERQGEQAQPGTKPVAGAEPFNPIAKYNELERERFKEMLQKRTDQQFNTLIIRAGKDKNTPEWQHGALADEAQRRAAARSQAEADAALTKKVETAKRRRELEQAAEKATGMVPERKTSAELRAEHEQRKANDPTAEDTETLADEKLGKKSVVPMIEFQVGKNRDGTWSARFSLNASEVGYGIPWAHEPSRTRAAAIFRAVEEARQWVERQTGRRDTTAIAKKQFARMREVLDKIEQDVPIPPGGVGVSPAGEAAVSAAEQFSRKRYEKRLAKLTDEQFDQEITNKSVPQTPQWMHDAMEAETFRRAHERSEAAADEGVAKKAAALDELHRRQEGRLSPEDQVALDKYRETLAKMTDKQFLKQTQNAGGLSPQFLDAIDAEGMAREEKARRKQIREAGGLTPLIDFIKGQGGIRGLSKGRKGFGGGELDSLRAASAAAKRRIMYGEKDEPGAIAIEEMAQMAADAGLIKDADPELLIDQVEREVKTSRSVREEPPDLFGEKPKSAEELAQQAEDARTRQELAERFGKKLDAKDLDTTGDLFGGGDLFTREDADQYMLKMDVPDAKRPAGQKAMAQTAATSDKPYEKPAAGSELEDQQRKERMQQQQRANQAAAYENLRRGNAPAVAAAVKAGVPLSRLLFSYAKRTAAPFNIRGAVINSPRDLAAHALAHRTPFFESLKLAVINDRGQVIHSQLVSVGTVNESLAHPREMMAIIQDARRLYPNETLSGFIITHNHPSGEVEPSQADHVLTRRMAEVADLIKLPLLDHVITNGERYYSFAEGGVLSPFPNFKGKPLSEGVETILPTPAGPKPGAMAEFEALPGSDRMRIGLPQELQKIAATMRTADPNSIHVLNLDTRYGIISVDRHPVGTEPGEIMRQSSGQGAYAIAISKPAEPGSPPGYWGEGDARLLRRMREAAALSQINILDMHTDGVRQTAADMGMMEEPPRSGAARLTAGESEASKVQETPPVSEGERRTFAERQQAHLERKAAFNALPRSEKMDLADENIDAQNPNRGFFGTQAADISEKIRGAADMAVAGAKSIRDFLDPAGASEEAGATARNIRANNARADRSAAIADKALRKAEKAVEKLDPKRSLRAMDDIETGKVTDDHELRPIVDLMTEQYQKRIDLIRKLAPGAMEHLIEHYLAHLWKDVGAASEFYKASLEGGKGFMKQRTIPTTLDGVAWRSEKYPNGMEPISWNFVKMTKLKLQEMDRFIMGQRIFGEERRAGRAVFVPADKDAHAPAGTVPIDDKIARVYAPPYVTIPMFNDAVVTQKLNAFIRGMGFSHKKSFKLGPGVGGDAQMATGAMRTAVGTAESVLMHELGHSLHGRYGDEMWNALLKPPGKETVILKSGPRKGEVVTRTASGNRFDKDLRIEMQRQMRALADLRYESDPNVSNYYKGYVRNQKEKIANAVMGFIYAPERMREVAPDIFRNLSDFIASKKELHPLLDIKPSFELGGGEANMPLKGQRLLGQYYAPTESARVLNNFLSPGWHGAPVYDAVRASANLLNAAQLGWSGFHAGFVAIDTTLSKLSLAIMQGSAGLQQMFQQGRVLEGAKNLGRAVHNVGQFAAGVSTLGAYSVARAGYVGHKMLKEYEKPGSVGGIYTAMVNRAVQGGWAAHMDPTYRLNAIKNFREALKDRKFFSAAFRSPLAAVELGMVPIMELMVPRMKAAVLYDMLAWESKQLPENASPDQIRKVAADAVDHVDNRLGQMRYDNLFWNKKFKDALMVAQRSVGWNLGTLRELGGGMINAADMPGRLKRGERMMTHDTAYLISILAGVPMMGALYQYLHTGQGPEDWKDLFAPRTGRMMPDGTPERVMLPSYIKDLHSYAVHPIQTVVNKLNPLWNSMMNLINNRDYYGTQIFDKSGTAPEIAGQIAKFGAKQFLPFSYTAAGRRVSAPGSAIESFFGIQPAPADMRRSAAQNLISDYFQSKGQSGAVTAGAKADKDTARAVSDILRNNAYQLPPDVRARLDELPVAAQIKALKEGTSTPMQLAFKLLPLETAEQVYQAATPRERDQLEDLLDKKRANAEKKQATQAKQLEKLKSGL